jgi:hypothetical protein
MFIKKVIHTRTNHVVTAVQLIMPVLFTIFGLLAEETTPGSTADPALTLDLSPFSGGLLYIFNKSCKENDDIVNRYNNINYLFTTSIKFVLLILKGWCLLFMIIFFLLFLLQ